MNDRILSFLGLCRKAGKTVIGEKTVEKTVMEKKACVILTASDFSENSLKGVKKAADAFGVPLVRTPYPKEALSLALGKTCGVLCVTDEGFSKKILSLLETKN